jgi:hypothetical protein
MPCVLYVSICQRSSESLLYLIGFEAYPHDHAFPVEEKSGWDGFDIE